MTLKEMESNEEATTDGKPLFLGCPHDAHRLANAIATHCCIASRMKQAYQAKSPMEPDRLTPLLERCFPDTDFWSRVGAAFLPARHQQLRLSSDPTVVRTVAQVTQGIAVVVPVARSELHPTHWSAISHVENPDSFVSSAFFRTWMRATLLLRPLRGITLGRVWYAGGTAG